MSFINNYTASHSPHSSSLAWPDHVPYDLNFCLPIRELETEKIKLSPLIPHLYAQAVFELIQQYPSVMRYMASHPFPSTTDFEAYIESTRSNPAACLFVILDKTKPNAASETNYEAVKESIMGVINYCTASPASATLELGFAIVFPPYQRTHVSTHTLGLMMQYALDTPAQGGLGMRRLQWQAHSRNTPSIKAAQRMGFRLEGTLNWYRPLAPGKESSAPFRADDSLGVPTSNSVMHSVCWDDWENGVRNHVLELMRR